jgi:hypothetical protein
MALNYFVTDETYTSRMDLCNGCENLSETIKQCSECKCIMPVKAKFAQFSCPINKWGKDYTKLVVRPAEE